jgi:hypothetical protein
MRSGLAFTGVLGFHESFQVVQTGSPKTAVLLDPGIDGAQRFGIELVNPVTSLALLADQMGSAQKAQVLGDRGARNRESAGNLAGWLAAAAQKVEDGATSGIGKGLEGSFGGPRR